MPSRLGVAVLGALLIINTTIALLVGVFDAWSWYGENGVIENAQLVVLLIAFLGFARLTRASTPVVRYLNALAMLACLFCVFREIGFEPYESLYSVNQLLNGPARIVIAIIAVPLFALFVYHCVDRPGAFQRLLFATRAGRLWMIGCIVVASGVLFDNEYLAETVPHRWEELLELNGFAIMAMASMVPRADAERAVASLARRSERSAKSIGPTTASTGAGEEPEGPTVQMTE